MKRLSIFILLLIVLLQYIKADGNIKYSVNPGDTTKLKKLIERLDLDFSLKPKKFSVRLVTLPETALNHRRFNLHSDYNYDHEIYAISSAVQKYTDLQNSSLKSSSIGQQQDIFLADITDNKPDFMSQDVYNQIISLSASEQYRFLWRANLVHVSTEEEMTENITLATREMIQNGMGDLEKDLLPLITMLMAEQKMHHYDKKRVVSTEKEANGIITSVQILNALATEPQEVVAGVCRDVHDMGLRMARVMYKEYLDNKYPDKNYNVDDYVFLQAWVTPSSQHITLVVLDPENPRNLNELDWGRLYSKKNQEGVEIGNNVGSTIRLWQYDPVKNVSRAIDLVKSQWGFLLDNEMLTEDELVGFNGIYNPDYSSRATYLMDFSKNSKLGVSLGRMNAGQQFLLGSVRSGAHKGNVTKFIEHSGSVTLQMMFVDDYERKVGTMEWADWKQSINLFNSVRYLSDFKTKPISIKDQFSCNLFFKSQLEFFISFSMFNNYDITPGTKYTSTGDGNIWFNYGAEFMYKHPSDYLNMELKLFKRNFLIPTDVRLLSPNPFELIKHAEVLNNGTGGLFRLKVNLPKFEFQPEVRYEKNHLDAEFIYGAIELGIKNSKRKFFTQVGYFDQINGLEYYWYNKSRYWFDAGIELSKRNTSLSFSSEFISDDISWFAINYAKSF